MLRSLKRDIRKNEPVIQHVRNRANFSEGILIN